MSTLYPKVGALRPSISPEVQREDAIRVTFLHRLDSAVHVEVTDWEARFIESFLTNPRPFTGPQRDCIDKMRTAYEARL